MKFAIILSSVFCLDLTVASTWNQTITHRGVPAFEDMLSDSYIPLVTRMKAKIDITSVQKRAEAEGNYTFVIASSEKSMVRKVGSHILTLKSGSCIGKFKALNPLLMMPTIAEIGKPCTGSGKCMQQVDINGFTYNLNSDYYLGNETQSLELKNAMSETLVTYVESLYKEEFSEFTQNASCSRGGACHRTCVDLYRTEAVPAMFGISVYKDGQQLSNMDVEFTQLPSDVTNGSILCDATTTAISSLLKMAQPLLGIFSKIIGSVICQQ